MIEYIVSFSRIHISPTQGLPDLDPARLVAVPD